MALEHCVYTLLLRGPGKVLEKNWYDLVQSGGAPKYVITNLKINNFKGKKQ